MGANRLNEAKDTAWKLIALSVAIGTTMAAITSLLAPYIPLFYNLDASVKATATKLLWVQASHVPILALTHAGYFTIRAGGRGFITFMLDSGFSWLVAIPVSWYIGNYTSIGIILFFFLSKWTELLKFIICIVLVQSGIWIRNIVEEK